MRAALAKSMMTMATRCLGDGRREWALAMQGEFEIAIEEEKPLSFAAGCLMAAWREMLRHEEGRFALANHGLALGLLIPIAGLQLLCAAGSAFPAESTLYAVPVSSSAQEPYLAAAYLAAVPPLFGLWLLLCALHIRLAWVLLEGDWQRVVRVGCLIASGTVTLMVFTGVLFVDDSRTVLQACVLTIEFAALAASARWHARLSSGPTRETQAG